MNAVFGAILNRLSNLLNIVTGGSKYGTVSGRSGHHLTLHDRGINSSGFWHGCGIVINTAFYPIEGSGHCERAYAIEKARGVDFPNTTGPLRVLLGLGVLALCIPMIVVTWLIYPIILLHRKLTDDIKNV